MVTLLTLIMVVLVPNERAAAGYWLRRPDGAGVVVGARGLLSQIIRRGERELGHSHLYCPTLAGKTKALRGWGTQYAHKELLPIQFLTSRHLRARSNIECIL